MNALSPIFARPYLAMMSATNTPESLLEVYKR